MAVCRSSSSLRRIAGGGEVFTAIAVTFRMLYIGANFAVIATVILNTARCSPLSRWSASTSAPARRPRFAVEDGEPCSPVMIAAKHVDQQLNLGQSPTNIALAVVLTDYDLCGQTYILFPAGSVDAFQFAQPVRLLYPFAQVFVGELLGSVGAGVVGGHGRFSLVFKQFLCVRRRECVSAAGTYQVNMRHPQQGQGNMEPVTAFRALGPIGIAGFFEGGVGHRDVSSASRKCRCCPAPRVRRPAPRLKHGLCGATGFGCPGRAAEGSVASMAALVMVFPDAGADGSSGASVKPFSCMTSRCHWTPRGKCPHGLSIVEDVDVIVEREDRLCRRKAIAAIMASRTSPGRGSLNCR